LAAVFGAFVSVDQEPAEILMGAIEERLDIIRYVPGDGADALNRRRCRGRRLIVGSALPARCTPRYRAIVIAVVPGRGINARFRRLPGEANTLVPLLERTMQGNLVIRC